MNELEEIVRGSGDRFTLQNITTHISDGPFPPINDRKYTSHILYKNNDDMLVGSVRHIIDDNGKKFIDIGAELIGEDTELTVTENISVDMYRQILMVSAVIGLYEITIRRNQQGYKGTQ